MQQFQSQISVKTHGKGLTEITRQVSRIIEDSGFETGLITLFIQHTSASLTIQENADYTVQSDMVTAFERLAPEDNRLYDHTAEGPDDMPAHIKSALTNVSITIPVMGGCMALGTWQGIYIFEHRNHPHTRSVICHVVGE